MLQNFIIGSLCAALLVAVSYKVKFLTLSGSVTTFILAIFIFGFGGWKWSVPVLSFFIPSSLLSKLREGRNQEVDKFFEKSGRRDYLQVISNGGIAGILVIINSIYPDDLFYLIYLSTLAAVCADTWATEIGTWRVNVTYNILNFQKITQGTSGGISMPGIIGAIIGTLLISLSGLSWIHIGIVLYFSIIIIAGILGCIVDSLLGATVQGLYKCAICEKVTEKYVHCGVPAKFYKGIAWFNNDVVNMFCGAAGALFGFILIKIGESLI